MKKYIGIIIAVILIVLSLELIKTDAVDNMGMTILDISKASITIEKDRIQGKDKYGNPVTETNSEGYYIMSSGVVITNNNIVVKEQVTTKVVLDTVDLRINQERKSAFVIEPSAKVELILKNNNSLTGGKYNSALQVPEGNNGTPAEVIITGDGELRAYAAHRAAAIGGSQDSYGPTAGKITIKSGRIIAETGGNPGGYGAAIGGAESGGGGTITIDGGDITAISNRQANAIGGGRYRSTEGTIIINDGSVNAKCNYSSYHGLGAGDIQINGGYVSSTSPDDGYASTSKPPVNTKGEKIYFVGIDFPGYNHNKVATLQTAKGDISVQLDNEGKSRFYTSDTILRGSIEISNGNKYMIPETIVDQNIKSIISTSIPSGVSLLNVEPKGRTSIYGDDLDLTYTVKDETGTTIEGVSFLGELKIDDTHVGLYDIIGDNLIIDSDIYNFNFIEHKDYEITKRKLVVSMDPMILSYGESLCLKPNFHGFAYNDTQEDLCGELTYVLDKSFIKPDAYTMKLSGYSSANYDIEFNDVSLTIVPATDGNYNYGDILEIGKNRIGEKVRWSVVKVTNNQTYLINMNMIDQSTWGTNSAEDVQTSLNMIEFNEYEKGLIHLLEPITKDSLPEYFENSNEYVFYNTDNQAISWWLADSEFDHGMSQNNGLFVDENGNIKKSEKSDVFDVRGVMILNKTKGISEVKIQKLQNQFYNEIGAYNDVAQAHVFGQYNSSEVYLLNEDNEVNDYFSIDNTGLIKTKEKLAIGNYFIKIIIKDDFGRTVTDTCKIEVTKKIQENPDDNKPGIDNSGDNNGSGNDNKSDQNNQTTEKPNEKESSKEDKIKVETSDLSNLSLMIHYCILSFGVICFFRIRRKE